MAWRDSMNRTIDLRLGMLSLALAATGVLTAPAPGYLADAGHGTARGST
jgi:hypothetical protein